MGAGRPDLRDGNGEVSSVGPCFRGFPLSLATCGRNEPDGTALGRRDLSCCPMDSGRALEEAVGPLLFSLWRSRTVQWGYFSVPWTFAMVAVRGVSAAVTRRGSFIRTTNDPRPTPGGLFAMILP